MESWPTGLGDHELPLLLDPTASVKVGSRISLILSQELHPEDRPLLGSNVIGFTTTDIYHLKRGLCILLQMVEAAGFFLPVMKK